MREILFRGKRLDDCAWVFGYYIGPVGIDGSHEICDIDDPSGTRYDVDPETVGQYTGLTDKNGKKIFEGDIMEFEVYGILCRGVVIIDGGNTGVFCKEGSPFLDDAIKRHDSVKIGNIHDNPELLNKEA